jgi:D-aspartate ligase
MESLGRIINMRNNNWKETLILGGTTTGLAFARSLGNRGIPVTVMENSKWRPAMHSRWATPIVIPDAVAHPEKCADRLLEWGKTKKEKSVLIPTLEEYVQILSDHREELKAFFLFQIPPAPLVDSLIDKRSQYKLMESCGLKIPGTVYSDEENFIEEAVEKMDFPCILKPCRSYIWRQIPGRFKAKVVKSARELETVWLNLSSLHLNFLVQEIIPGEDDNLHSYMACYSGEGRPLAELTAKKIRQNPASYGTGCLLVSCDIPEISVLSRSALENIGYVGHVDMEYKWDNRDRFYKLIEANIRCTGLVQLAISSGIDLPWLGYLDTGYQEYRDPVKQKNGVFFMHIGWDLQSVLTSRGNRISGFYSWLLMIRKAKSFAVFNLKDIKPIIWVLSDYFRKLPRWLYNKTNNSGCS